jgi:hypothetical protein
MEAANRMKTAEEHLNKAITGEWDGDWSVRDCVLGQLEATTAMETYATQQTSDLTTQLAKANSDKEKLGELLKELHIELGERKAYPLEHGIYFMGEIEQTLQDCGITL